VLPEVDAREGHLRHWEECFAVFELLVGVGGLRIWVWSLGKTQGEGSGIRVWEFG
jgi:hypothetical protein